MEIKQSFLRLILISLVVLTGCSSLPGVSSPTPTTAAPTQTPPPTPTRTPIPPDPLVILVVPADLPKSQSDTYQSFVYDLAQQAGYRFQVRNSLSREDLEPSLKVVIALPPDPGLADLAAAAPLVQFLAVGIRGLEASANLTTIGATGERPDLQGFLAGYIAAVLTKDWRVGIMIEKDSRGGTAALEAFRNGVIFYCGLCNPAFPPWYRYPIAVEVPASASDAEARAFADALRDRWVQTVYIYPTIASPQLLEYLADSGIQIIGAQTPPDSVRGSWVASIEPDLFLSLASVWPDLLAGKGGSDLPSPLTLTNINPDLLSPGRQRLAEEMLSDLLQGFVDTGVRP